MTSQRPEPRQPRKVTQTTPRGVVIPVPKRGDVLGALRKAAEPKPESPKP